MIDDLATHQAKHVTVEELAAYWSVSAKTIYRHIDKGALDVLKLPGGTIRIPIENARRYGKPNQPSRE
jgi:excisionase family DNA binding protein